MAKEAGVFMQVSFLWRWCAIFLLFPISTLMQADDIKNLIIIGSGPAGLAAALCAGRMQLEPLVIEGDEPGGALMQAGTIENWPGEPSITGSSLIARMRAHALQHGAQFTSGTVVSAELSQLPISITLADGTKLQTWSIIIASGTTPKKINCPGEQEYWGNGVAICPICDGPLFKKQPIIVVGSGDEAMTRALFMLQYTHDITLICGRQELGGSAALRKKLLAEPHINVIYNASVTEIVGDGSQVIGIYINNQEQLVPAAGVFLALGEQGCTTWCGNQLARDAEGRLLLTGHTTTTIPGVFAAGTVAATEGGRPYTLALSAAGSGCMAALAAWQYVCDVHGFINSLTDDVAKLLSQRVGCSACNGDYMPSELLWC